MRAVVDTARQEDLTGFVNLVLRCCVNALFTAIDFLNKFTINFAAITGEAYCLSARMTYELLKRNLLSAVFVETISTRLLAGIAFVLSAIYAIVVRTQNFFLFYVCQLRFLDGDELVRKRVFRVSHIYIHAVRVLDLSTG